jgi:hypothetical protein
MATPDQSYPRVTIPATSGYSSYVEMRGKALVVIETPVAWTSATPITEGEGHPGERWRRGL